MYFFDWNQVDFKPGKPGASYKTIRGQNMQMFCLRLDPGHVTDHTHPQEQMGYFLSGKVELTIGVEKKICSQGDAYYIPGGVRHGFKVLGDEFVIYLEIFSPPKPEHKNL